MSCLLFAGCMDSSTADISSSSKASLVGGDQGIFTIELEEVTGKIHYGYTVGDNIVFNGHVGSTDSVQYYNYSRNSAGQETIIADVGVDGIPDYWIMIGVDGEVLEKVPFAEFESPF